MRRLLPLAPLAAALAADGAGAHRLAFYLLLLAVPAAVVAGLDRFAAVLDGVAPPGQAVAGGIVVVLVVLSEAARGPHLAENAVPALALSSLAVALALVSLQAARLLLSAPLAPVSRRRTTW
jgi:hypothetical protein